jgi:hypothetical protein
MIMKMSEIQSDNSLANKNDVSHLQDLLDAVPAGRMVACLHDQNAVILHDGEKELGRIPLDGLLEASLLDDSTVQTSYSAIKFFILGPLAFLFPKKRFERPSVFALNGKIIAAITMKMTFVFRQEPWRSIA